MHERTDRYDQGQPRAHGYPKINELIINILRNIPKKIVFKVTKPPPAFTNMNQLFIEKAGKRSLKSVTYPRPLTTETNKEKPTKRN